MFRVAADAGPRRADVFRRYPRTAEQRAQIHRGRRSRCLATNSRAGLASGHGNLSADLPEAHLAFDHGDGPLACCRIVLYEPTRLTRDNRTKRRPDLESHFLRG